MAAKLILCGIICLLGLYVGEKISREYKKRIETVEIYISVAGRLKSAVEYSGENLYTVLDREKKLYSGLNGNSAEEKYCAELINGAVKSAEDSNGISAVTGILNIAEKRLDEYKKVKQEEYRGKIKVMPSVGLAAGLFLSVLIV